MITIATWQFNWLLFFAVIGALVVVCCVLAIGFMVLWSLGENERLRRFHQDSHSPDAKGKFG